MLFPEYNSLSKASALKVNTALRKFSAFSLQGERQKPLATYPSCLESYRLELNCKSVLHHILMVLEERNGYILAYLKYLSTPI